MNVKSQTLCAFCGVLCPLLMFIGFFAAAGFYPLHTPTESAAEIAAIYQENAVGIRLGMLIIMIAGALYLPFTGAITAQMRRIETRETPVLTYTQLASGVCVCLVFVLPALFWTVAAFRPERSPELLLMLNDFGWFFFVMPTLFSITQGFAIGFAIISDSRTQPVFPRWVGFFNFWIALLYVPGLLVTFFKSGPFAWNGLLAFWVPALIFSPWFWVMALYVIKAARQQATDSQPRASGDGIKAKLAY